MPTQPFDSEGLRDQNSNGVGGTYCANNYAGCNAWAVTENFINGDASGSVLKNAEINDYLNGEYFDNLDANSQKQIVTYSWNIGGIKQSNDDLAQQIKDEKSFVWEGKVGLINASDYLRASSDSINCNSDSALDTNYESCKLTNWLTGNLNYWTINPVSSSYGNVYAVAQAGMFASWRTYDDFQFAVRPCVYLSSSIRLSGTGTSLDPYVIEL